MGDRPASFTWRDALTAAWLGGVLAALGHGAFVLVRVFVMHHFSWTTRDLLWMGPPSYFLYVAPVALLAYALTMRRTATHRMQTVLTAAFTASGFGVLLLARLIHPAALLVFAAGAAMVVARWVVRRPDSRWRVLRRATVALTAACALGAIGVRMRPLLAERAAIGDAQQASDAQPNVLIVVLDAVRAASMQTYGYHVPNTPALTQFAREGTKFDWAFATASWSLPSHASILTGLDARDVQAGWTRALPDEAYTLGEHLSRAGMVSGGFIGNSTFVTWENNLDQGFARWEDFTTSLAEVLWTPSFSQTPFVRRLAAPDSTASRWDAIRRFGVRLTNESHHDRVDAATIVDRTLGFQERVGDRRWFAVLNVYDAHDPYDPPGSWRGRLGGDDGEQARYDACIGYIDSQLGRLFDELRQRGVLDRTLVIVTADHGELFGEHGMLRHSEFLYLNSIHVPLLVRYPGHVPAGRVVDAPVALDRLPATILDLLGDHSLAFPGLSLRATWDGSAQPEDQFAVSWIAQAPWGSRTPATIGPVTSVVDTAWHWLLNADGRQELYHYRDDRAETRDRAGDASLAATMLALRAVAGRPRLLP